MDTINIVKAKLARGGQMNTGEIKLVVRDMCTMFEEMQEQLNELTKTINAVPRGCRCGTKESATKSKVQSG